MTEQENLIGRQREDNHGPKIITLSQSIVKQREQEALENQPLRREVHMNEIELYDDEHILYKGNVVKITKSAFSELLKVLQIPSTFIKRFYELMNERPEARRQFINNVKNVMSSKGTGSNNLTLILSAKTREIIGVRKNSRSLISNKGFIDVVNKVIDINGLEVIDYSVSADGSTTINALNTRDQWDVAGLKDEFFSSGVSFRNNVRDGFIVTPYINRLVCANGMISKGFEEEMKLNPSDSQSMEKFFSDLNTLAKNNYTPQLFVERVEEALRMKASLGEMERVARILKNVAKDISATELEAWVPIAYTTNAYKRIGIDPKFLNAKQLQNAKTDTSVWTLINSLTHFATHAYGFDMDDYSRRMLQVEAGRMLTDDHDLSNFVRDPFK